MLAKSSAALWALLGLVTAAPNHAPTVVLRPGRVIGTTTGLPSSTATVNKFLGIPFAVTPPKRFLPPERLARYDGPVDATRHPPLCIQQNYAHETAEQVAAESEDCLYLNVYTPAGPGCKGKAVMFWIHGGDLTSGTSSVFDGTSLAANQDVVVVTINYRVNAFGFSNAPNLPLESRNVGFLDQRMALDWVQENIAAFGGDPAKVTIFGESSGASSIDRLLTTMGDDDRLPFRAAILQSGQATVSPFPNDGGPAAWRTLVSSLNCTSSSSPASEHDEFECVQKADALAIRDILHSAPVDFGPATDNITQRATPFADARRAAKVPLLIGSNGQEGMNLGPSLGITDFSSVTSPMLDMLLTVMMGSAELAAQIRPLVDLIHSTYPWFNLFQAGAQLYTEALYQCPTKIVTDASVQESIPTWRYYFNATIPNLQPEGYPTLGAFHGADLDLVFGTYPTINATEQQVALSAFMQTAWATFAKDPNSGPGWKAPDGTSGDEVACLGCEGDSGVQMIPVSVIDARCSLLTPLFTASTPAF